MFQKWVPFPSTVRQDTMPQFSVSTTVCTESSAMHTAQKIWLLNNIYYCMSKLQNLEIINA